MIFRSMGEDNQGKEFVQKAEMFVWVDFYVLENKNQ